MRPLHTVFDAQADNMIRPAMLLFLRMRKFARSMAIGKVVRTTRMLAKVRQRRLDSRRCGFPSRNAGLSSCAICFLP